MNRPALQVHLSDRACPRLLDLFAGAGGCSVGYERAGFDVTAVDIEDHPNHPGTFIQGDALTFPLDGFDAYHASPPCQAFSLATGYHGRSNYENHPDLVDPIRQRLLETGKPFVIENVAGAPIRQDVLMCGEMFGLRLHRHRYFECEGFLCLQPRHSPHLLKGAEHNCDLRPGHARQVAGNYADHEGASAAMGIDWMNRAELAEAIPPAYTEHIGGFLMNAVAPRAVAA